MARFVPAQLTLWKRLGGVLSSCEYYVKIVQTFRTKLCASFAEAVQGLRFRCA
jgi:hypothetical protein